MAAAAQFVTMGIAGEIYAAPVEKVQEILDLRPVTPLPRAPGHLLGLVDVRGEGIPVVDLRALLGMGGTEDGLATRFVVLGVGTPRGEIKLALKTDQVFEVTALDEPVLAPPPDAAVMRWRNEAIAGIGRRGASFVTVLDLDRLFAPADLLSAGGSV